MDQYGPDDDDLKANVVACRLAGLTDLSISGDGATLVRGIGTDRFTDRRFVLEVRGSGARVSGFEAFEIAPDIFPADDPSELGWMIGSQDSLEGFLDGVSDGDTDFWNNAASALLSLGDVAAAMVTEASWQAALGAGERLSGLCGPDVLGEHHELPDVEAAFQKFAEACLPRLGTCQWMNISWLNDYERLYGYVPNIRFGLARGTAHPVTYGLTVHGLNLNGVPAQAGSLESDLEDGLADPWARIDARQAAQDLLSIEGPATRLMSAHHEHILAILETERSALRYNEFLELPDAKEALSRFERATEDRIIAHCREMETRIDAFLMTNSYGKLEVVGPTLGGPSAISTDLD